ncbi:MAG: hypothetical protein ACR2L2_12565 [Acidobacteriota bacterium]
MTPQSAHHPLTLLDQVFSVMDSPTRPQDFGLVLHLKKALATEALCLGAASARRRYPVTGCRIHGKQWVRPADPSSGVRIVKASCGAAAVAAMEEFIDSPLDLRLGLPVQQLLVAGGPDDPVKLITRFHHAASDGLSAAMWLSHQLAVAWGLEEPAARDHPFQTLPLLERRRTTEPRRLNRPGRSARLQSSTAEASRARRWYTIELPASDLRKRARSKEGFSYNDLLITCSLEVFRRWISGHNGGNIQKVAIWLPVNIRRHPLVGFGNGSSRIRVYPSYAAGAALLDKCREIHRQIASSVRHGGWRVPRSHPLQRLPEWLMTRLIRGYLNRPWVDVGTAVFSHVERWKGRFGKLFEDIERIECIGQLHASHSVAINGMTHGDQTSLTFTYDPALLSPGELKELVDMYQKQIAIASRELQ